MATTTQLRRLWSPVCKFEKRTLTLHSGARITVNAATTDAWKAIDAIMQSFSYQPRKVDTGAYNCRKITGGSGYSLHAYGIAVDYNWNTNPYGSKLITDMPAAMVAAIKGIKTKKGLNVFRWGGDYRRNKDAMHYEVIIGPADLKAGIDWSTVPADPPNLNLASSWPVLHKGDRGPSVEKLHESLAKAGFKELDRLGTFGTKTDLAVRAYQESRKLDVDGWVGLGTWTALLNDMPKLGKDDPSPVKLETRSSVPKDRPTVRYKDESGAVQELQRRLTELHLNPGPIDGIFGSKTRAAVKEFQRAHRLAVDGIVGPKTWAELYK